MYTFKTSRILLQRLSDHTNAVAILIAVLSTAAACFLLISGALQLAVVVLSITVGAVLYLGTEQRQITEVGIETDTRLFYSAFFLCISTAFILLIGSGLPVFRPIGFFVAVSGAGGTIGTLALRTESARVNSQPLRIVGLSVILAVVYKTTYFLGGIHSGGGDAAAHILRASALASGKIASMPGYSDVPGFHILWSVLYTTAGIGPVQSKYFILLISSLGAMFVYILTDSISEKELTPKLTATVFIIFPLTNRVKVQSEALVFLVLMPLLLYVLFNRLDERKFFAISCLLYLYLSFVHFYYSALYLGFLVIYVSAVSFIPGLIEQGEYTAVRRHLQLVVAIWITRVAITTVKINWGITKGVELVTNPLPTTAKVQPSFLTVDVALSEFVLIHLSEFLTVSLVIVAGLGWVSQQKEWSALDRRRVKFYVPVCLFGLLTAVGILVEGQKHVAWGISFRNTYMLAIFLSIMAGAGLTRITLKTSKGVLRVLFVLLVLSSFIFLSMTSQQANNIDPVFYAGDEPSPRMTTEAQVDTLSNLYEHMSEDTTVVSDLLLTRSSKINLMTERPVQGIFFSRPSLPELNSEYDYLLVNEYAVRHGMLFKGAKAGFGPDEATLSRARIRNHRVWSSGAMTAYRNSTAG